MVDDATDRGVQLADADKNPTIARDGHGVGNRRASASARGGGALGWRQKAGAITQRKYSIETMSKDEDDGEG